ncbi:MAG: sigma-70 family RNA polymerase sigma factor [Clostridiales bacterium]|nr:sigma-70 family RNA polymerase sigma factor [Clostridiales bacterium]
MEVVMDPSNIREDVLRRLMAQYKNDLMRMSYAYLKDATLAEDAVQETFVKAYQAMATFRGESSEKTWLMRIAINTCRNIKRDSWFRFVDRSVTTDSLPQKAASAEEHALTEAVMNLSSKHKEVVLLYYYQGMTLQEISEALNVAISTISTRLKKARERLRRELEGGHDHA